MKNNQKIKRIKQHFGKLQVFLKELDITKELFNDRINKIDENIKKKIEFIEDGVGVKPTVFITSFNRERTDPILNLYFKSFFFVYRQAISSSLKIIFLIKNEIQQSPGTHEIPDASQSGNFSKFYGNLKTGKFTHYNKQIINFLDNNSDMLIIPRIIRNQIKEMGTIPV